MIKKISYVILSGVISIALYLGSVFIVVVPIQRASGHSPESFLGLAFLIVIPACVVIGSAISGYLIQPIIGDRSLLKYLLISPGIYMGLLSVLPTLYQAGSLLPDFVAFSIMSTVVWGGISIAGTRLGLYLKDRKAIPTVQI
jgi:hypothetical protein